jgi:hypothetical protein
MKIETPLYIPSFSTGEYANYARKNTMLGNGTLTPRFYSNDFPEQYRHKNFLLTAGHLYKKMDIRKEMGLEDSFVMGDSGGYQIATGIIKWSNTIRQQIFEWLEENSDLAMNIDLPPNNTMKGRFQECLDRSVDNFKYFYENQTGKTKFLNVLQGHDLAQRQLWYNSVKDYQFNGWAAGGCRTEYKLALTMAVLCAGKEHLKDSNEYLHILGTSRVSDFFFLAQIQKSLTEVGSKMRVTTDSSSPSRSVGFGLYYLGANLNSDSFKSIHIPKGVSANKQFQIPDCLNSVQQYQHHLPLPKCVEFDNIIGNMYTYGDCVNNTNDATMYMTLHNFMLYMDVQRLITDFVYHHDYILEQVTSKSTFQTMKIIDEIIKSDDPIKTLNKHETYLISLATAVTSTLTNESISEFFTV